MKSTIEIMQTGITDLDVDVIVNAANTHLREGGGVCGAIFHEAGSEELAKACNEIGRCNTGDAVITPGFNLKADYIIHAVGPIWKGGDNNEEELLYSAYENSLKLAKEHECHSIGFPLISSGIYGYPKDEAWKIALKACRNFLRKNSNYNIQITFAVLSDSSKNRGEYFLNNIIGFHMKCPHCNENVNEGDIICSHCKYEIMDFNYFENLEKIEKKYGKSDFLELSKEKLTYPEIITIRTFIKRSDRHAGDTYFQDKCENDGTYSNFDRRIKEIKNNS